MSCSSSYSHPKPLINPTKQIMKTSPTTVQPSNHQPSLSNQSLNAHNIESLASASTGSAGGVKSIECGASVTTTSLISGSLFDHRDSKHTLNSTTTNSANKLPHKSTSVHVSPSMTGVIVEPKHQRSSNVNKPPNDFNNTTIQNNQKGSQSSIRQTSTGSRLSRRGVACAG